MATSSSDVPAGSSSSRSSAWARETTRIPRAPETPAFPSAARIDSASTPPRSTVPDWTISGPRPLIFTVTAVSVFVPSSIAVSISYPSLSAVRGRSILGIVRHPQLRLVLPVDQAGLGLRELVEHRHHPLERPRALLR